MNKQFLEPTSYDLLVKDYLEPNLQEGEVICDQCKGTSLYTHAICNKCLGYGKLDWVEIALGGKSDTNKKSDISKNLGKRSVKLVGFSSEHEIQVEKKYYNDNKYKIWSSIVIGSIFGSFIYLLLSIIYFGEMK